MTRKWNKRQGAPNLPKAAVKVVSGLGVRRIKEYQHLLFFKNARSAPKVLLWLEKSIRIYLVKWSGII
ncbi:MAG: hypothetical protein GY703_19475 [Gammaproteobacteria bacterium]|nr:hypothetical protein [Gammaproteobacteria bacterium]